MKISIMKISVVATVALLSLLAVASSAPHPGDHEGPGYQYEQEVQLQTDGSGKYRIILCPSQHHYHKKVHDTVNFRWFTCSV